MGLSLAWRIIIFIVALILAVIIIPVAASLITNAVNFMGESITAMFRPFALSGEDRLQGLIKLCLYLVVITFLIRFLLRR